MRKVDFYRDDAVFAAGVGVLLILAACAGLIVAVLSAASFDLKTVGLMTFGFFGVTALGAAFINAWRTPLLTIRPDALVVPTFLGAREIPIAPGHPVGEFLGPLRDNHLRPRHRPHGSVESEWFAQYYTVDSSGALINLISFHRDRPLNFLVRRALEDVAGLEVETLKRDHHSRRPEPDVRHWKKR